MTIFEAYNEVGLDDSELYLEEGFIDDLKFSAKKIFAEKGGNGAVLGAIVGLASSASVTALATSIGVPAVIAAGLMYFAMKTSDKNMVQNVKLLLGPSAAAEAYEIRKRLRKCWSADCYKSTLQEFNQRILKPVETRYGLTPVQATFKINGLKLDEDTIRRLKGVV